MILSHCYVLDCFVLLRNGITALKNRNKPIIDDMNRYLRDTKRGKTDYNDDIESVHGSQSIMSDRQVRANARADYTNGRQKNNLRTQILKYGMGVETPTDDKGWIGTDKSSKFVDMYVVSSVLYLSRSSYFTLQLLDNAQVQQKKSRLRKGTSKSSSPPITSHFLASTRKTRSSSRAKSANGDVITIESSEDEGDDTSNDASEVSTF